jgi:hypothetical protein
MYVIILGRGCMVPEVLRERGSMVPERFREDSYHEEGS